MCGTQLTEDVLDAPRLPSADLLATGSDMGPAGSQ